MPLSKIQLSQAGGRRNLVHNGSMRIAQRAQVTGLTTGAHRVDRYKLTTSGGADVTANQVSVLGQSPAGDGLSKALRIKCTTADTSVAAGDYSILYHRIEGQDLQHLQYGTSDAKKLTVQFWVQSAKTGIHIVELTHLDAGYRNAQQYTISSANTWEKKTVTFVGYQTTAFDDDANGSLQLAWWLLAGSTYSGGTHNSNTWHNTDANRAVGQVNVLDAVDNNFYLTGVQMEVGELTEFEHLTFGEELALCQRYYTQINPTGTFTNYGFGIANNSTTAEVGIFFPVEMRAEPSLTHSSTLSHFRIWDGTGGYAVTNLNLSNYSTFIMGSITVTVASGLSAGNAAKLQDSGNHTGNFIAFSAEL